MHDSDSVRSPRRLRALALGFTLSLALASCAAPTVGGDAHGGTKVKLQDDRKEPMRRGSGLTVDGCDPTIGPVAMRGAATEPADAGVSITFESAQQSTPPAFAVLTVTAGPDVNAQIAPRAGNGQPVTIGATPITLFYAWDAANNRVVTRVRTGNLPDDIVWEGLKVPNGPGPMAPADWGLIEVLVDRTLTTLGSFDVQAHARDLTVGFHLVELWAQAGSATP